jgi:membrane-associated protease RseP (regulator of RpoE activity)
LRHPAFHAFLFISTAITTTLVGAIFLLQGPDFPSLRLLALAARNRQIWLYGMQFSIPLLLILGVHEFGHVIACRKHGLPATLPYFIPSPFGIGTLGAVIRIRAPIQSKRALLDVGASGPLAGICVAIPVLIVGISTSTPTLARPTGPYLEYAEPLLFKLIEHWRFPQTAHGADLQLSPTGFAGWFGLLITALNLLPLAQLDGGHVIYSVLGRFQRPVAYVLFAALAGLAFLWPGWIVWAVIVLILGIRHPPTADESERLDAKRKFIAFVCLLVFIASFTPIPVQLVEPHSSRPAVAKTYRL